VAIDSMFKIRCEGIGSVMTIMCVGLQTSGS
jgi:hypothetical protein